MMTDYSELYESLTQTERITWDLAESDLSFDGDYQIMNCPACYERIKESYPLSCDSDCPYRRAVEWKAELIARWEAENG